MDDAPQKPKRRGGCLSRFLALFVTLILVGLVAALAFIFQPQDLSDIQGRAAEAPVRDLQATLKESLERGFPVTITEAQLNTWIAHRLEIKQGGILSGAASLDHVWVRLEEGRAEIVTCRTLLGRPITVSLYIKISQEENLQGTQKGVLLQGGTYHEDLPGIYQGGRFGKLVVPQGFLILVLPAYEKLAAVFPEEINQGFHEMSRIEIKRGNLILTPDQAASNDEIITPGSF